MPTSQEIFDDAQKILEKLQETDADLDEELRPIEENLQTVGTLSDAEKATRENLNQSIGDVRAAHIRLALITLARLDNSTDIDVLLTKIDDAIGSLNKTKARIAKFGEIATNVTNVLNGALMLKDKLDQLKQTVDHTA